MRKAGAAESVGGCGIGIFAGPAEERQEEAASTAPAVHESFEVKAAEGAEMAEAAPPR